MIPARDRIETARLDLRRPVATDLPAYVAYCASDRSRFVGGPFDAARAFEKLAAMAGHWDLRGFGRYVMVLEGRAIGHVGPLQICDAEPPEMTWTLWDGALEGQGFAREAARAVTAHLLDDLGWPDLVLRIARDNAASRQLAERLGAVPCDAPAPAWMPDALTYRLARAVAA